MRKLTPARVSYRDDFLILYRVYIMTESFHISLFEGTLHVDKIQVWFKIANITRVLPIPVYRQTDFTPKGVVVLRLHDTAVRFCTRVKFLPRYKNRGEVTLGWLALAWYFVVVSCKQIYIYEREPVWTCIFHKGSNNSAKPEQQMISMSTNSHNWIRFIWLLKIQNVWLVWVKGFP